MKRCDSCNVSVYDSEPVCPLCYRDMGEVQKTSVEYPKYRDIISGKTPLRNLPLFIAATAIIVCIYINLFTYDSGDILWSLIVSAGVLYGLAMYYIIRTPNRYGARVLYGYLSLSALLVILDFSTGRHYWSTDFAFPFLTIAVILYLTVLALRSKRLFSEYFGYILVVTLLSFLSVFSYILGFYNYSWGAFVTVVACVIIALGLYLFADKALKAELKKRFHRG